MSVTMDETEDRSTDGARQATPTEMATLIAGVLLGRKRGWRHVAGEEQAELDIDVCGHNDGSGIVVTELEVDDLVVELDAAQAEGRSESR